MIYSVETQSKSAQTLTIVQTFGFDLPVDRSDVILVPYDEEYGIVRHWWNNVTWQASCSFHHCFHFRYGGCNEE